MEGKTRADVRVERYIERTRDWPMPVKGMADFAVFAPEFPYIAYEGFRSTVNGEEERSSYLEKISLARWEDEIETMEDDGLKDYLDPELDAAVYEERYSVGPNGDVMVPDNAYRAGAILGMMVSSVGTIVTLGIPAGAASLFEYLDRATVETDGAK